MEPTWKKKENIININVFLYNISYNRPDIVTNSELKKLQSVYSGRSVKHNPT